MTPRTFDALETDLRRALQRLVADPEYRDYDEPIAQRLEELVGLLAGRRNLGAVRNPPDFDD